MSSLRLSWSGGRAQVLKMGGMLSDLEFSLEDGRQIAPLHKAPWLSEAPSANTPALLANLQGEWPCVPFGAAPDVALIGDWAGLPRLSEPWPHGYAANHSWTLSQASANRIDATIAYPDSSPIKSLSRHISAENGQTAIDLMLSIEVHEDVSVPIGLHPVFKLPDEPGAARLHVADYSAVWIYPGDTGAKSAFAYSEPLASFADLKMPACEGWDPLSLPYPFASESILLLSDCGGSVTLENRAEAYRTTLTWDARVLPSLMLWISNMGRASAPWNKRHRALGIEPVCSAFDFGSEISKQQNPLNMAGVPTVVKLSRLRSWRSAYRLTVESI